LSVIDECPATQEFPVDEWLTTLSEDLATQPLFNNYRTYRDFQTMSQEARNAAALYIVQTFDIAGNDLGLPSGQIGLAAARNSVASLYDRYATICGHNWTGAELLILLQAAWEKTDWDSGSLSSLAAPPVIAPPTNLTSDIARIEIINDQTIALGEGAARIELSFPNGLPETTEQWELVNRTYQRAIELNSFTDHPLTSIAINFSNCLGGTGYDYLDDSLRLETNRSYNEYEQVITHEWAHFFYAHNIEHDETQLTNLNNIRILLMGFQGHELVDDSNYSHSLDYAGHPEDSPDELLASSCADFHLHADELLANIDNPSLPRATRQAAIALWCFIRDNVFQGQTFTERDPFSNITTESALSETTSEDVILSLEDTILNGNPSLAETALDNIRARHLSDPRLIAAERTFRASQDGIQLAISTAMSGQSSTPSQTIDLQTALQRLSPTR
jgi:hypothetical protein